MKKWLITNTSGVKYLYFEGNSSDAENKAKEIALQHGIKVLLYELYAYADVIKEAVLVKE